MKLLAKKIIFGCEARGDGASPYLTRITLPWPKRWGSCYLHIFHRSDNEDALHDHPWDFVTFVIWGWYREHLAQRVVLPNFYNTEPEFFASPKEADCAMISTGSRLVHIGQWLYRPADTIHRVELLKDRYGREKPAITICWVSPKRREWGFWHTMLDAERLRLPGSWEHYKKYFERMGC